MGSQHLSRMLSRFLSSCVFSLAQVFSGVHQILGVGGNAHQVQGSSAETPTLVDVMPWACLAMRAQFVKLRKLGQVWRILRLSKADKNEMLRQQGTLSRARSAHLADPFVKVKGLLTDLVILFPPLTNDSFYCTFAASEGGNC